MKVGDFYEAFDEDAKTLAERFNVALTHRSETPVVGIPYHAVETYIVKLMKTGIKVALCEWVRGNSGEIEPDLFISCDN